MNDQEVMAHLLALMRKVHQINHQQHDGRGQRCYRGQNRILVVLNRQDNLSQRELADAVSIKQASLTEALERLESDGLVHRGRDPHDKRIIRVCLTDKGRERVTNVLEEQREFEHHLLENLNDEDREHLVTISEKMLASINDNYGKGESKQNV